MRFCLSGSVSERVWSPSWSSGAADYRHFFKTKAFEAGSRQVQEYNKASNFAERFKLNSYSSNDSSIMLPAALRTVLSLILTAVR